MAAPRGGGNKRKDGDMGRGGGPRGRGAWGRGAPNMNAPYQSNMNPNMGPGGMNNGRGFAHGPNGYSNYSSHPQMNGPPSGLGNGPPQSVKPSNPAAGSGGPGDAGFRTDLEIAPAAPQFKERDLVGPGAWANDTSAGLPPLPNFNDTRSTTDDLTFGAPSSGAWDQFAANEKLFGVTTTFDENQYTTPLDRTASDYQEREKVAQKLADEILNATTTNTHLAEERGIKVDDSGINEEDKYSGVVRNPNVYVPPAARRAAAAAAAANGSPSSANKALSPQPSPAALSAKASSPAVPTAGSLRTAAPAPAPALPSSAPSAPAVPTLNPTASKEGAKPSDASEPTSEKPKGDEKEESRTESAGAPEKADVKPSAGSTVAASPPAPSIVKDKPEKPDTTAAKVPQVTVENPLVQDFRNFVHAEKERLTTQRKNLAKSEKDKRIADLIRFSSSFKLSKEIPEDLVDIMTKDEERKKQILEKSKQDAKAQGARAIGPAPAMNTSASTRYGLGVAQAANAVKSPAANAIPPSSSASAAPSSSKPVKMAEKYAIPDIPPFNPNKAKAAVPAKQVSNTGSSSVGKATPTAGSTPSTSPSNDFKLNINASSFRPNAHAPTFKPVNGASPSPAPSSSPARTPLPKKLAEESAAPSQPNPFFGSTPLKKGSVHIKDDFSPFKHNKVAEASSTPSTWPFVGKRYASLLPPQPTPPPPQPMPGPFEDENPPQLAQATMYMQQMYAGYRYGYPGPPQPGQPPMPIPGPNGYMPPPQFMPIYGPIPGVPGGAPPAMYPHPMMSPMGPPAAQYMQSPVPAPSPYPGAPNGAGAGRGSIPPTPLPPHAYAHYPNPQMAQGIPYQMMMAPGLPNGPPVSFEAQGPPMPMGPPH